MLNLSQKGVSLYIALMMITVILGIALGISVILIGQVKMIRGIGDSVIAFSAADTGIEKILYDAKTQGHEAVIGNCPSGSPCTGNLDGTAAIYSVTVLAGDDPACPGDYYCLKSVGNYKETRRAIQISR